MAKQATQELKDLDVERVDGVDRPATGRSFMLFKGAQGEQIVKGYALVATAADQVLKSIRKDATASVSRSTAIALNGLAQIMGQEAVFVGKAVPTQPYEIKEDLDVDARGPADEKLGTNFVARSASPSTMVDKRAFTTKGFDFSQLEDDEDKKAKKAKAETEAPDVEDEMVGSGIERSMAAMAKAVTAMVESNAAVMKSMVEKKAVAKAEDEAPEPVRPRPRSRQVEDDEPVSVRKSDYQPRLGANFSNIVFGQK